MKNLLPCKILLSIAFCFALMSARAQYVTIPDTNFVNWLNTHGFAGCMVGNQMDTTCGAVVNRTTIDCQNKGIYDLTGITYFDSLIYLVCSHNNITSMPALPPRLKYLECGWNFFNYMPFLFLPAGLISLNCHHTGMGALPALPSTLQYLDVGECSLSSLPSLPAGLIDLYAGAGFWQNSFTSLPPLPSTLTTLVCDHGYLSYLPSLPASLITLECGYNYILSLPTLPNNLQILTCGSNQLTSLPSLPASLLKFDCSGNYGLSALIPSLILPPSLTFFGCVGLSLTTLPVLPSTLNQLWCNGNSLSTLPALPPNLTLLSCTYNLLTSLPSLPNTLNQLWINNNPSLTCLPPINHLSLLSWANTGINCLPNSLTVGQANPPITNVPLCAFSNPNNCPVYWSISGTTLTDTNANCLADTNEVLLRNLKVKLFKGGILKQQAFSNNLGQYAFTADTGAYVYSIDTNLLPLNVVCPASFSFNTTITNGNPQNPNKDFSLECKSGFDVGITSVLNTSGRFRPGNNITVSFLAGDVSRLYNKHCATGISGVVTIVINGPVSFVSAAPGALTPTVIGDTLIYAVADFGVTFPTDFSIIVQTDTTAQAGDNVCFDVTVTPLAGDNNTTNNNYAQCFTVRNSYDPNEKEVYPEGSIDTSLHYLTYTVYFQNTGNDTAQFVYVLDTLDNAIDESSIQLLAYSHEPLVQVMGNVVKFNFPNINLPDSTTDEPNSHGYVQYRVRLHDGLLPGTVIHNTGYIYFDFNPPVVTNTTFDQIDIITGLTPALSQGEGVVANIYPNPIASGGELKIVFSSPPAPLSKRGESLAATINIFDMSGRKVFVQPIYSSAQTQNVKLPFLARGIYQCVIDYSDGISRRKLVVAGQVK